VSLEGKIDNFLLTLISILTIIADVVSMLINFLGVTIMEEERRILENETTKEAKLFNLMSYFIKIAHEVACERFKHTELFPEQPILLLAISKFKPINQKTLAEYLKIKPSTLTLRLQKLEAKGLIERINNENDKRIQYVTITSKGKETLKEGMHILKSIGAEIFDCLDENDIDYLKEMFDRLIEQAKLKMTNYKGEEV